MHAKGALVTRQAAFIDEAQLLADRLKKLTAPKLKAMMHISPTLAAGTKILYEHWGTHPATAALDAFQGDIYKGLQAESFTEADRAYTDDRLRILSGLYGLLRPLDGIEQYRLEVGYRMAGRGFKNLYDFWGSKIVDLIGDESLLVNLASQEYFRMVEPYLSGQIVIEPVFMTIMPRASGPKFVAYHAKLARGAFARWLITERITDPLAMTSFTELGYRYDETASTATQPVFITQPY